MKRKAHFRPGTIVSTVHTRSGLHKALALGTQTDWIELRLDLLPFPLPRAALRRLVATGMPLLCTARDPREGGRPGLGLHERLSRLLDVLPVAAAIDVELMNTGSMRSALQLARAARKSVVVSFHDFTGTPALPELVRTVERMACTGAHVGKIATLTRSTADVARLLALLENPPLPLAVMGMGKLGSLSRPIAAACGSVLNYAYVDKPQVPGQWAPAALRTILRNLSVRS